MKRFYTTFPGRWPGVGLLLLRMAVSGFDLAAGLGRFPPLLVADHSLIVYGSVLLCAALVALGLFTQLGASLGAVILLTVAVHAPALMWAQLPTGIAFATAMLSALSLVFLGAGSISLDAYLFGPKEIVIPRRTE